MGLCQPKVQMWDCWKSTASAHIEPLRAIEFTKTVGEGIAFYDEYAAHHLRVLHDVTPIDLLVQSAIQYALPKRNALAQMKSYTTRFMGTKTQVAQAVGFMHRV